MQNPQTIREAFLPLNTRLYEFESEDYLFSGGEIIEVDPNMVVKLLLKTVSLFEDEEIFKESKLYELRVLDIIGNLKYREKEGGVDYMERELEQKPISKERQEELMDDWKFELHTYLNYLRSIQKSSNFGVEIIKNDSASPTLTPPNESKFSELNQHTPVLSSKEAALFLYYLQEIKVSPEFSKIGYGKLARLLFGRNEQNVRELFSLTDFPFFTKDLKALKERLTTLINRVGEDIKIAEAKPNSKK